MRRPSVLGLLALGACGHVIEGPTPEATGLTPSLACNAQLVSPITLSGSALAPAVVDAFTDERAVELPELALVKQLDLGGDAADGARVVIPDDGGQVRWLDASTMSFDVTEALALEPGVWRIEATNLDGQVGGVDQAIAIVPPPVATAVDPAIVCVDQHDVTVTVTGTDLLGVDDALPTATIGELTLTATALDGCTDVVGAHVDEAIRRCTSATFVIPAGSLQPAVYDLSVTNPAPAGCTTAAPLRIEVVPPPTLAGIAPALVCNEQASEAITATGTGFLALGEALPTVAVGDAWTGGVDDLDGCTDLLGPVDGSSCTSAMFTIPAGSLPPGVLDVVLTNPEPADCHTEETVQLENVPPPVVTGLSRPAVCVDAPDEQLTVEGEGFVVLEAGTLPTVTIGGTSVDVLGASGCVDLLGPAGGQTCTGLDVLVPEGTFDQVGSYPVQVDDPAPADCTSNDDVALEVTPPPTIAGIEPDTICTSGGTITITGTGFQEGAEVTVAGVPARQVTLVDAEHLLAELPAGLPGGFVEVTVANPDGCDATVSSSLQVVAGPVLFFVDPPVIYGGVDLRATLFVSGVIGDVTSVSIEDGAGTTLQLDDFAFDGHNLVSAVIPAASADLADGPYTVHLTDESACTPYLDDAFAVESDLTVSIDAVTPAFGWTGEATAVNVLGETPLPAGAEGFQDLPRVYLSPTGGGDVATGLQSVTFVNAAQLDAVVPPGLAPGASPVTYDVVVVNPDGAIGLLPAGFTATVQPPPTIDTVSPTRLTANTTSPITIHGSDFRAPSVDLLCEPPGGAVVTVAAQTTGSTSDTITATVNPGAEGSVCVVRVTDDDGTSATWSAISARSASGNLFGFGSEPQMGTPRRAPAATVGHATAVSRWLYAIGGDDGTTAGAYDTLERTSVDPFGHAADDWLELPDALPAARTTAGVATVGDFVWLVGGHDGTGPVDTVLRAEILDPQDAPRFADLGIVFGSGTGLGGGTWTYRIAARFAADDPRNPGGESLASDPIVVRLPDVPDRIVLSLAWTPVDGAIGYRVYRSATANAGSGAERFLADVAGATFTDDGEAVDDTRSPLPSGALGRWDDVGTLPGDDAADAAREAPCVTAMPDPGDPDRWWILVAGGRDGHGDDRATITRIGVDLADPDQVADTIELDDLSLATARRACAALPVDDRFHAVVDPGEAWLYVVGGFAGSTASTKVEAFRLMAGGALASHADATVDDVSPARAACGHGSAGDFLFLLGGQSGNPTASGTEAEITGPPELDNWNNLGGSGLSTPRVWPGSAQDAAVLFIVGGRTGTEAATRSLESSRF